MTHPTQTITLLLVAALLAASSQARSAPAATRSDTPTASALRAGVTAAIDTNHTLSDTVLWTNRIPHGAVQSTQGPALTAMTASAAQRHKQGLRVRMLRDRFRIVSINLTQAAAATAVVQSDQLLAPSDPSGKPLGRPVSLDERAQIQLRRVGTTGRFIVWSVTLLP